jgi:hypothetical protein
MTDFNSAQHPRIADGSFTDKAQSAPETNLVKQRDAVAGERVLVADRFGLVAGVDGETYRVRYANGDQSLETAETAELVELDPSELIEKEATRDIILALKPALMNLDETSIYDVAWTSRKINEGAWGDSRQAAYAAYRELSNEGLSDPWLVEDADEIGSVWHERRHSMPSIEHQAVHAARDAAWAVAARHLIGRTPGWTQDAYDHLTRPWRANVGELHPEDAPINESREVARFKLSSSPSLQRVFDRDLAKLNGTIARAGAIVYDDGKAVGVDEEKIPADIASAYSKLQQFGYANGLIA